MLSCWPPLFLGLHMFYLFISNKTLLKENTVERFPPSGLLLFLYKTTVHHFTSKDLKLLAFGDFEAYPEFYNHLRYRCLPGT